jgi:hypothetical protein
VELEGETVLRARERFVRRTIMSARHRDTRRWLNTEKHLPDNYEYRTKKCINLTYLLTRVRILRMLPMVPATTVMNMRTPEMMFLQMDKM